MKNKVTVVAEYISQLTGLPFIAHQVYIDLGANWKEWTVVSVKDGELSYQVLSPRDILAIEDGTYTFNDMDKVANEIIKRGW